MRTRWTPERLAELARLAKAGKSMAEAATALGVTVRAASNAARRGIRRGPRGPRKRIRFRRAHEFWPEDVRELRELVAEGANRTEVAEELGLSLSAASRLAQRAGVRFPKGPAPDANRLALVTALVAGGVDTAMKLAPVLDVHPRSAWRTAATLVRLGALERRRFGRASRLVVTRAWARDGE